MKQLFILPFFILFSFLLFSQQIEMIDTLYISGESEGSYINIMDVRNLDDFVSHFSNFDTISRSYSVYHDEKVCSVIYNSNVFGFNKDDLLKTFDINNSSYSIKMDGLLMEVGRSISHVKSKFPKSEEKRKHLNKNRKAILSNRDVVFVGVKNLGFIRISYKDDLIYRISLLDSL